MYLLPATGECQRVQWGKVYSCGEKTGNAVKISPHTDYNEDSGLALHARVCLGVQTETFV